MATLKDYQQLDQVYCAWLIKWWIISGTWWYWVSIWRYWLVLGQYKLVLLDIRWYMVSKGLVCLYILEKVKIWSVDTNAWNTDSQTTEDRNGQTNQPNVFPPQIIHTPDFLDECKFWRYVRTSPHKFCICNQTSSTVKVRLPIHAPHLTLPRQLYLNKNIWAK